MKSNEIKLDDYVILKNNMTSSNIDSIIESHKKLIGKKVNVNKPAINNCGIEALMYLLTLDWGRNIVYQYNDASKDFMKSKYLSNYIKYELKKMLVKMNYYADSDKYCNDKIKKLLNSNKTLSDMTEEEIKYLFSHVKESISNFEVPNKVDTKIANCFNELLYKLDGEGIKSLLKDDEFIEKSSLVSHILLTSGLSNRSKYYSGRGVNFIDLDQRNLLEIFKKLLKIDINYAISFVNMVMELKTLSATEFIESFELLAKENFDLNNYRAHKNYELVEYDNDDIMGTNIMKNYFLTDVKDILEGINPKLNSKIEYGYIYRRR